MTVITQLSQLPNLAAATEVALDLETVDPNLKALGPGDVRGDGRVVGVALAVPGGQAWYLPLGHEERGQNLAPGAQRWLRSELARPGRTWYGAQLDYDLGWCAAAGWPVQGAARDVLHAGRLLDLWGKYPSLDELLVAHGLPGKTGEALWAWLAARHGGEPTRAVQIGRLATAPATLVGAYACGDVAGLFELHNKLEKQLHERSLWDWYLEEEALLPTLVAMRRRGVRFDVAGAERLLGEWERAYAGDLARFGALVYGSLWAKLTLAEKREALEELTPASSGRLRQAYAARGIRLPETERGQPSINKAWLQGQADELSVLLRKLRTVATLRGTHVLGVLPHVVRGRLHPTLKQLWPRTLRLSSENPSEQNMPKRDAALAPLIRGLWLPEEGERWLSMDDAQQEYRLAVHFAVGPGAAEARARYQRDPATDYHQMVADLLRVKRDVILKNANFSYLYRAGKAKFAATIGRDREWADPFYERLQAELPFVATTAQAAEAAARRRGYVRLMFAGARLYFDRWSIDDWDAKNAPGKTPGQMRALATAYLTEADAAAAAQEHFGLKRPRVGRYGAYTALNSVIQPSGAQRMKRLMGRVVAAGLHEALGLPLVTVHDELGFSLPATPAAAAAVKELKRLAEEGWPESTVPFRVSLTAGPDLGHQEAYGEAEGQAVPGLRGADQRPGATVLPVRGAPVARRARAAGAPVPRLRDAYQQRPPAVRPVRAPAAPRRAASRPARKRAP